MTVIRSKPPSPSTSDIYPVHRLAAKALIADWQDAGRSEEDVVSLSVESSVISSHTAFIAIDEENSKPVEGALQTWDIKSNLIQQDDLTHHMYSQMSKDEMLTYSMNAGLYYDKEFSSRSKKKV